MDKLNLQPVLALIIKNKKQREIQKYAKMKKKSYQINRCAYSSYTNGNQIRN